MLVDLSGILKSNGAKIDINTSILLPDTDFLGEMFSFNKPVCVKGSIFNDGETLEFNANIKGSTNVVCSRCLAPLEYEFDFDFTEYLKQQDGMTDVDDESDIILFSGNSIDISDIILNNFLTGMPGKYLCSESCKGVCPDCGANLNVEQCSCNKDNIDPRFAVLKELLKNDD